ncbi:MAG: hypothetical protein IJ386_06915 [Clostridia bacterium]|nr:hypothetical protein [Clostridia bacterium]
MSDKKSTYEKTPQDRYHDRVGLISKSYKLKKEVVEAFAEKCKENGVSQASAITGFMLDYIRNN